MTKKIVAKTMLKLSVQQAAERKDLAIIEIQISGETLHFSMQRANLRNLAEGLMREAERFEAETSKPN